MIMVVIMMKEGFKTGYELGGLKGQRGTVRGLEVSQISLGGPGEDP